ncbi:MAG: 5'-3' exonuclease H3TH domain-containing protein, partial [Chloroflexota bacterium]
MTDTLVLIDGHALVFRAFYGVPPLTSPSGELVNAVHGFTSMLFKAWRDLKPKYVIATFDFSSKTFRKAKYPEYKATRGPAPDGLAPQFPHIFNLLECMNIPVHSKEGFEADDLLGTLSKQAEDQGLNVVILTGDMDALQLVSPHVRVLTSRRGFSDTVLYDEAAVEERYGFEPNRIPDFKALRGDTSDNIPGVPGIGDKTASKLIQQFDTVENLYQHLADVPARQRGLLEPLHDQVMMAKDLATIIRDVDIKLDLTHATLGDFDRQRVVGLFHDLGFRRLLDDISRSMGGEIDLDGNGAADSSVNGDQQQPGLFDEANGEAAAMSAEPPAASTGSSGQDGNGIVRTLDALDEVISRLKDAPSVSLNVQTTGVQPMRADIVGLGLATGPDACWYIPTGHAEGDQLTWDAVRDRLTPVLSSPTLELWSHN